MDVSEEYSAREPICHHQPTIGKNDASRQQQRGKQEILVSNTASNKKHYTTSISRLKAYTFFKAKFDQKN